MTISTSVIPTIISALVRDDLVKLDNKKR